MNIAFFDFDGTITKKDSLFEFIKFAKGNLSFYFGFLILSPMLVCFKLGLISNQKTKELTLKYFFYGLEEKLFKGMCKQFSIAKIDSLIRPKALERIKFHKNNGDSIVVVSASLECWLKDWCMLNNIALIATKALFENQKFSGKFATKNCYGLEKVIRIKQEYDLKQYKTIYAYGDSIGDKPMLTLAHHFEYKPFV